MDEFSNAPMRRLPWDLRDQAAMSANTGTDTEDVSPFVWPEDPDERTLVPFYLSQREYTAIASAVDVGSDIAFSTDAIRVWWAFVRNMRYAVPICDLVTTALLTCEDVQAAIATLIATNPVIQDSLRTFVTEDEAINQHFTEIVQSLTEGQINGKFTGGDCNNSVVAGRVVAIVERLNAINEDALEIIEVGTNDEEKLASVIAGIPGLGIAPVDEIIDFAQDLLEDFAENYFAAVTEEWKDSVEEDLYCLAKESEDCSLTYKQLFDYFQNRAASGLTTLSTILEVVDFVRDGDFNTDDLVASGLYAIQLGFLLTGREFFGMNLPRIGAITRDALPSSKWEDWDECGTPPVDNCENLTSDDYTWYPSDASGVEDEAFGHWQTGVGLVPHAGDNLFNFWRTATPGVSAQSMTFTFNQAVTNFYFARPGGSYYGYTGTAATEITFDNTTHPGVFPFPLSLDMLITFLSNIAPSGTALEEFCWEEAE